MRTKTEYIILGALALISLVGFALPEQAAPVPARILLSNAGGRVVFDHRTHADVYGIVCADCHHEVFPPEKLSAEAPNVTPCGSCHGVPLDAGFRAAHTSLAQPVSACVTCHHLELARKDWGHDAHSEDFGLECTSCHHDVEIEATPQNCADCHKTSLQIAGSGTAPGSSSGADAASPSASGGSPSGAGASSAADVNPNAAPPPLSLKDAVHQRCASCHQDKLELGLTGCAGCHTPVPVRDKLASGADLKPALVACSVCHAPASVGKLIPNRMSAFHAQCIGCHEQIGSGPTTDCAQCHTK